MSQLDSNWSFVDDSEVTPEGFLFAGISAGLKASNKKDLALILAPEGSIFSGMFTQSIVRALVWIFVRKGLKQLQVLPEQY